jgi:hypothetical protein
VHATTNGSGPALKGSQSGSGLGLYGEITNKPKPQAAVSGATNGTGRAIQGTQSGKSGSAVSGQVSNAKNAAAAIDGAGSSIGRGGQFAGVPRSFAWYRPEHGRRPGRRAICSSTRPATSTSARPAAQPPPGCGWCDRPPTRCA